MRNITEETEYKGFKVCKTTNINSLRAKAYELEHIKTGAKILHLHTDDTENCFAITFPTPPPDETGLPHILEHSVLAGSEKYPVFEPFFEMVKNSMATFINALTSQMFTTYPVASTVKKDFFNLADVYMDAVFHPHITEKTFRAEGHHFTLENNDDLSSPLKISGIVYSEMKGYWSTPDNLIGNLGIRGLFPDTPLRHDSGGNPEYIPNLTYQQFKNFYETYYHPSNALFYIYGNIPTTEILDFLSPLLSPYDKKDIEIPVIYQTRWKEPRRITHPYPIGDSEHLTNNTYIILDWLVADATNPQESIEWSLLSNILLGNEGSPLKKAIIDSKLGADIYPSGDFAHAYELVFEVGIKGSEKEKAQEFEQLVKDTLLDIASNEISREMIDAAFHQLTYHHQEVTSSFPMKLMWLCEETWPYKKDPLTFLHMDKHLEECKNRYNSDPLLFNNLIKNKLLNNPHFISLTLYPDKEEHDRAEKEFSEKMAKIKAGLSKQELINIAQQAKELSKSQTRGNTPEQIATLPQLHIGDLPDKPAHIPTETSKIDDITVLRNDVFCNGINYINIDIDLSGLPHDLHEWIPHYVQVINKMGTENSNYAEISHRKNALTGSIECKPGHFSHVIKNTSPAIHILFKMKALDENIEQALDLLYEIISMINPDDKKRLLDITRQYQAKFRTNLVNNAFTTAQLHAARCINYETLLNYKFGSREGLYLVDKIMDKYDTMSDVMIGKIEAIRKFILNKKYWTISFTGSDYGFTALENLINNTVSKLPATTIPRNIPPFECKRYPREGLAAQLKVGHCAMAMPAPSLANKETPFYKLGLYLSQFDYFLPQIRFKGNAYGAGAQYNGLIKSLTLFSYNDPRIKETLDIFNNFRDFINNAEWSQADIERAIIGSAKKIVTPIRPEMATKQALSQHITGLSKELKDEQYKITLSATAESVKKSILNNLEETMPQAGICVAANKESLEKANSILPENQQLEISNIF